MRDLVAASYFNAKLLDDLRPVLPADAQAFIQQYAVIIDKSGKPLGSDGQGPPTFGGTANGGELGFFELETIGAMQAAGDRLLASTLLSETLILRGTQSGLLRYLSEEEGLQLDEPAMSTLA